MTRLVHINDHRVKALNQEAPEGKISYQCCVCHKMGATLADLDGEPWKAYYHAACLPEDERAEP